MSAATISVNSDPFAGFRAARAAGLNINMNGAQRQTSERNRPATSIPVPPRANPIAEAEPSAQIWMRSEPRTQTNVTPPHYLTRHTENIHAGPWDKSPPSAQHHTTSALYLRPSAPASAPRLYDKVMALDGALSGAIWRLNDGLEEAYRGIWRGTASTLSMAGAQVQTNGKAFLGNAASTVNDGLNRTYSYVWRNTADGVTAIADRVMVDQRAAVTMSAAALMATTLAVTAVQNVNHHNFSSAASLNFGQPAYAPQSYAPVAPVADPPASSPAQATPDIAFVPTTMPPETATAAVLAPIQSVQPQGKQGYLTPEEAHQHDMEMIAERVVTEVNRHGYLPGMQKVAAHTGFSVASQMAMIGAECSGHLDIHDNPNSSAQGDYQILRYTFPDMVRNYWQQDRDFIADLSPHIVPIMDLIHDSIAAARSDPAMHGHTQKEIDDYAATIYKHQHRALKQTLEKEYHQKMHDALKTHSSTLMQEAHSLNQTINGMHDYSTFRKASILARRDFWVSSTLGARGAQDGLQKASQTALAPNYTQGALTWLGHFLGDQGASKLLDAGNSHKNAEQILQDHNVFKANRLKNAKAHDFILAATKHYTDLEGIFNARLESGTRPTLVASAKLGKHSYH